MFGWLVIVAVSFEDLLIVIYLWVLSWVLRFVVLWVFADWLLRFVLGFHCFGVFYAACFLVNFDVGVYYFWVVVVVGYCCCI